MGLVLFISPLLYASWDIWSKTIIHLLTAFSCFFVILYSYRDNLLLDNRSRVFILFLFWLLIATIFSKIKFNSELELYNWINYFLVFSAIYAVLRRDLKYSRMIFVFIAASSLVVPSLSFYQFFIIKQPGEAVLLNINVFAGYLVITVPFLAYLFHESQGKISYFYAVLLAFNVLCLFLTKSVAGIFGLFAAFLIVKYKLKGVLFSALLGFMALAVKLNDPEVFNRYVWWYSTLKIIIKYPLLGVGPGNFEFVYPSLRIPGQLSVFSHSYYLQLCSEIGIIGLIMFLSVISVMFRKIDNPFFKISIAACLLHNLFDYTLYIPAVAILFWCIFAIALSREEKIDLEKNGQNEYSFANILLIFVIIIFSYNSVKINKAVEYFMKGKVYSGENYANMSDFEAKLVKSTEINPDIWYSYGSLGDLYLYRYFKEGGKSYIVESIIEYKKAVEYNEFNSEYYYKLAFLYKKYGDESKAAYYLNKAVCYNPLNFRKYINSFRLGA